MKNTELKSLFHNLETTLRACYRHDYIDGERSLSKTHTFRTNDKGETAFATQSIRAVSCACWCWNIRIRDKHCQGWKSAVWFSRHFTADLWLVNLASELQGCIQFFSWLQCVADLLCAIFSSEKFPVPSEWIMYSSSSVFFSAKSNMLIFDWSAKTKSSFHHMCYLVFSGTNYQCDNVVTASYSIIKYTHNINWVAFIYLN